MNLFRFAAIPLCISALTACCPLQQADTTGPPFLVAVMVFGSDGSDGQPAVFDDDDCTPVMQRVSVLYEPNFNEPPEGFPVPETFERQANDFDVVFPLFSSSDDDNAPPPTLKLPGGCNVGVVPALTPTNLVPGSWTITVTLVDESDPSQIEWQESCEVNVSANEQAFSSQFASFYAASEFVPATLTYEGCRNMPFDEGAAQLSQVDFDPLDE